MDVLLPCTSFRSVNLKPESSRSFLSTNRNRRFSDLLKCRRKTISTELQATVDVAGRTDDGSASIPTHKVTVHDRERGVVHEFVVPEDQYILHTAEAQSISLPFACRHGCCTSCAVRIKSGQIRQPEALGISAELKSKAIPLLDSRLDFSWGVCTSLRRYIGFNLEDILPGGQLKEMTMLWSWLWLMSKLLIPEDLWTET
ncbi:hypothetical protein SDJN02_02984, partial [Cucurbita argyrosperma subsp. argyrosperma]